MGYAVTFGLFQWSPDGSVDRVMKEGARQLKVGMAAAAAVVAAPWYDRTGAAVAALRVAE